MLPDSGAQCEPILPQPELGLRRAPEGGAGVRWLSRLTGVIVHFAGQQGRLTGQLRRAAPAAALTEHAHALQLGEFALPHRRVIQFIKSQ